MYFIYDCNGTVIGNAKGYRTFRGAERQQNGKLQDIIWERYYDNFDGPTYIGSGRKEHLCSIKLVK